jgi:Mn-dependent DtxR family transcriptional regulator
LALLKKKALITSRTGSIVFTPEGNRIAQRTYRAFVVIQMLMGLAFPNRSPNKTCRIEHIISETTFSKTAPIF